MEAIMMTRPDQPISPYNKHNRNRNPYGFRSTENFPSSNLIYQNIHGGILFAPPPTLPLPYSSFSTVSNHRQPPLLPLPISKPYSSLPTRNNNLRNLSTSPPSKNNKKHRNRNLSTSPKKSSSPETSRPIRKQRSESVVVESDSGDRLGPEPCDLPKEVGSRVLKPVIVTDEKEEEMCGSIFSLAPPPSSLPLPRFSMKPKVSCNLQVIGVDSGATDDICRLLRLR